MTPSEFAEKMREIYGEYYPPEEAHVQADKLLCEVLKSLGYDEGVRLFEEATRWYS
jgi:hypothetical protein